MASHAPVDSPTPINIEGTQFYLVGKKKKKKMLGGEGSEGKKGELEEEGTVGYS